MDLEMWKQTKDIAKRNFIWPITHGSDYKAWSFFLLLHIDLCNSDGGSRFILGTKMAR